MALGNFPTGGAVTADGRFLWTVSAGFGRQRHTHRRHGPPARDPDHSRARRVGRHRSGLAPPAGLRLRHDVSPAGSRRRTICRGPRATSFSSTAGRATCGQARLLRVIPVPPPPGAPPVRPFRSRPPALRMPGRRSWRSRPTAASLLVPLNLADSAAVIDLNNSDQVRYVPMASGSYPFGAAVLPDGRTGLVSNEATGTLSVVDLQSGVKLRDITVGPPLSHPEGIVVDRAGARAYVALSALDEVVVVDLRRWRVERTISVGRSAGLGTMPVALALGPRAPACSWPSRAPMRSRSSACRAGRPGPRSTGRWWVASRRPTTPRSWPPPRPRASDAAQLMYVAARGVGVGPNPTGPVPTDPFDPIFWAFNPHRPHHGRLRHRFRGHLPSRHGRRPGGADVAALKRAGQAAHPRGVASDTSGRRSKGPRRDAAARRRADQACLLRGAREPQLRPAAGRCRPRQQRPPAGGVRART